MSNVPNKNGDNDNFDKRHRSDPQVVVTGHLKEGENTDVIVFTIPLGIFEIVCIVTVPAEGTKFAPVYLKLRIKGL